MAEWTYWAEANYPPFGPPEEINKDAAYGRKEDEMDVTIGLNQGWIKGKPHAPGKYWAWCEVMDYPIYKDLESYGMSMWPDWATHYMKAVPPPTPGVAVTIGQMFSLENRVTALERRAEDILTRLGRTETRSEDTQRAASQLNQRVNTLEHRLNDVKEAL